MVALPLLERLSNGSLTALKRLSHAQVWVALPPLLTSVFFAPATLADVFMVKTLGSVRHEV